MGLFRKQKYEQVVKAPELKINVDGIKPLTVDDISRVNELLRQRNELINMEKKGTLVIGSERNSMSYSVSFNGESSDESKKRAHSILDRARKRIIELLEEELNSFGVAL